MSTIPGAMVDFRYTLQRKCKVSLDRIKLAEAVVEILFMALPVQNDDGVKFKCKGRIIVHNDDGGQFFGISGVDFGDSGGVGVFDYFRIGLILDQLGIVNLETIGFAYECALAMHPYGDGLNDEQAQYAEVLQSKIPIEIVTYCLMGIERSAIDAYELAMECVIGTVEWSEDYSSYGVPSPDDLKEERSQIMAVIGKYLPEFMKLFAYMEERMLEHVSVSFILNKEDILDAGQTLLDIDRDLSNSNLSMVDLVLISFCTILLRRDTSAMNAVNEMPESALESYIDEFMERYMLIVGVYAAECFNIQEKISDWMRRLSVALT